MKTNRWRSLWEDFLCFLTIFGITLAILAVIGGCVAVKWNVYHQRFPQASWWAFLIK